MRATIRRLAVWLSTAAALLVAGRLLGSRGLRPPAAAEAPPAPQPGAAAPAYAAGAYMSGRRPGNSSSCGWYRGLPAALSYPASRLAWTPEIGEKSPYRVLPFVLRGSSPGQVTLCTHATADQVYGIVELARRWEGPLSLAVFAPGLDAGLAVALLDRACRCEPEMYKISVHLVFPAGRPPALGQLQGQQGDCAASDLQWRETERKRYGMTYPINVARNVARTEAATRRVLVSDIELLPSRKLASGFAEMVRSRPLKVGVAFVLPVFEVEAAEQPPSTKRELLDAVKAGTAVYFHRFLCPHCQRFPGLSRWLVRPDPGRVKPLIFTKREYPHHRWEPVFIGTKEDPLYNEELSWEGRQDKMAQMFEMCLLNYRLVVLDGAFLVHTPGIKRKPARVDQSKLEYLRPLERRNAKIYQRVIRRLLKRYPANPKCAQ